MTKKIYINIWDDYHDDGFVPEGEIQETFAYVEGKLDEDSSMHILSLLKEKIEQIANPEWDLSLDLNYYDSAKEYPHLVGSEHAYCLYKRWQLEIKNLTHKARESLVEKLDKLKLVYDNTPIIIYSES